MSSSPTPLEKISDFHDLVKYYENNKDKPFSSWLKYKGPCGKPGKQGLVGLLSIDGTDQTIVFKISQYINYLIDHEYTVMKGLMKLSAYCPHFCKTLGLTTANTDPSIRKTGNPFEIRTKYPIEKEVLLCEHIDQSTKFYNYIRATDRVPEETLYTTVEMVLMALAMAQKKQRFTHYDIHSFNVMMKKCQYDAVFLYILDENNKFLVPTRGKYPVIIDFGFSYISDMEDGPLWPSMGHTSVGFTSDRFDWVSDPKLFLVTVSHEIKQKRDTKTAKRFRRLVKNMFFPLEIDWYCGWDSTEKDPSISDVVIDILSEHASESKLFVDYDFYCIDILNSLIILPLEKQDTDDLEKSFCIFLEEWLKIEREITSPFYSIFLLKCVIDVARELRGMYSDSDTRDQAVSEFQRGVYDAISKITQYCTPKNVHYEKLLCSLYVFSKCLEGTYYNLMKDVMKNKEKTYKKLPVQNIEQILAIIQTNIEDGYVYSDKTEVIVLDAVSETTSVYSITQENADLINETHPICRGTVLHDILCEKN